MKSLLIFLAACGGIVAVGWIVSKLTGSRAFYLEDWKFADGETVLWRDEAADVFLIPTLGQARVISFARRHRSTVVVTSKRILVGAQTLFGNKRMVLQVLYRETPADGQSEHLDGGLLTVGYQALVIRPEVAAHLDEKQPYVDLLPADGHASSTNLQTIRIYTDSGASFRLP